MSFQVGDRVVILPAPPDGERDRLADYVGRRATVHKLVDHAAMTSTVQVRPDNEVRWLYLRPERLRLLSVVERIGDLDRG